MYKLFKPSYGYLFWTLRTHFRTPKTLIPLSHLHSGTESFDPNSRLRFIVNGVEELQSSKPMCRNTQSSANTDGTFDQIGSLRQNGSSIQISHPWPEWVDLMEGLLKRGYFADENPFENNNLGVKEANVIRTACLNFARDQYSLVRNFSRKDIQVIAGCGCPSIDRKVVNSGKRLRAHVGIDEGNVCSSCNLRGNCERAFVRAREEEGGRTVDVMRILLTYGLDPITGSVENKPCQNKIVKESVRRLLKEMVNFCAEEAELVLPNAASLRMNTSIQDHLSTGGHIKVPMKQGDWHCPKCDFLNFARNIKCLRCDGLFQERLKQLHEDQDHLPLKKGDWICDKCNFLNFAKNTRCLQCKEKPPKRPLNPGEWECESCNYINFRRNMVCLKCDHKRPKASNASNTSTTTDQGNKGGCISQGRSARFGSGIEVEYENKRITGADKWRFVHEENKDHNYLMSSDDDIKSVDFPIAGGKSYLSRNPEMKEKWKSEMSGRSKTPAMTRENDESRYPKSQRKLELLESTDDEMADWFRPHIKERI
ncbi:hypothetical protein SLE2022_143120 [Rubroshorea leprosula]